MSCSVWASGPNTELVRPRRHVAQLETDNASLREQLVSLEHQQLPPQPLPHSQPFAALSQQQENRFAGPSAPQPQGLKRRRVASPEGSAFPHPSGPAPHSLTAPAKAPRSPPAPPRTPRHLPTPTPARTQAAPPRAGSRPTSRSRPRGCHSRPRSSARRNRQGGCRGLRRRIVGRDRGWRAGR